MQERDDEDFLAISRELYGASTATPQDDDEDFLSVSRELYGSTAPGDEEDKKPSLWQRGVRGAKEFGGQAARGVAAGLSKTGTSLAEVVGMIPGAKRVGDWARRTEAENRAFYDPQGTAGAIGEFVGRGAGEIATAMLGGGAVAKGVGALARGGTKLASRAAQLEAALTSASKLKRGAATAAVNLPVDVVQGLKEEEGLVLPGRFGSVAEGVLFSGGAGALGAALDARKARLRPDGPQQGPDLPPDFNAGPQHGQARGALMEPRLEGPGIPQGSGRIPPSRRLPAVSSADEMARRAAQEAYEATAARELAVEREAIRAAEDAPADAWALPLEKLQARLKPVPRSKKNLAQMSDDDLLDHAIYRTRVADEGTGAREQFDEIWRVLEANETGKPLGLSKAKKQYGGDISELGDLASFTEEQVEALRDIGLEPRDVKGILAQARRAEKGAGVFKRIDEEVERRGLSLSRDMDALEFNPAMFDDDLGDAAASSARSGAATGEALGAIAGGGVGALTGAWGAGENATLGERLAGAATIGTAGALAGAAGMRRMTGTRPVAPPTTPPATPPFSPVAQQQQARAKAEEAITFPAKPTPRTAEYQPISDQAMGERLQRRIGDEDVIEGMLEGRRAGEVLQRQGRRSVADELAVADERMRTLAEPELMDPKRKLSGAEIARLDQRAEGLIGVQKKLQQAMLDESVDSERKVLMQEYINDLDRQINNTVVRATRDASQSGRDLAVLRYAKKTSSNPFDWMRRVTAATGGDLPPESWAKIQQALQANDFAKAQIEMGKLRKGGVLDQLGDLYQTGLLTNVTRPIRDVLSNTLNLADKQLERATATVFDRMVGVYTGTNTAAYDASSLRAMAQGFKKGREAAKAIMRGSTADLTDKQFLDRVMKRYDFERETIQSLPWLRAYTTFVRRTIGASDALVSEAALQASLAEQARVFARQAAKPGTEAYDGLVRSYLTNPPAEAMGEAMSHAMEVTWQNSTMLGEAGMGLRRSQSSAVRLLGKMAVPFVQTPSAMITQTVKGTPFGLLSSDNIGAIRDLTRKTNMPDAQRKLVNQLAKTSIGSAWIGLGYVLSADDKMTAFYPSDDRERRRWELEGRTEAALKLGGTWVSLLGMLGPQAQLMTLGAALRKMTEDEPEWTAGLAAKTMATGVVRAALDSPMLQGIKTISDVAQKAGSADADALGESLNQAAQTFITGAVPQAVQQAARFTDTNEQGLVRVRQVREPGDPTQTAINALMQGVPGLRQQVPVRRSALGEERALSVGGFGVLSPARLSRETTSPQAQELWRTGAAIARTPRRKGESQETYEARQQALGTAATRAIDAVMQSEGYQRVSKLPTEQLRATLAGLTARGDVQADQVAKLENLSDEKLRARLQGIILEKAISRVRTYAGRAYPDPARGRSGSLLNALTR